jgi:hypothetical protein
MLQVLPETIDTNFFYPHDNLKTLPLPGTILDQFQSLDEGDRDGNRDDNESIGNHRPFVFCSVFKMEERKGYRELVEGFIREFQFDTRVVLLLRTYLHTGTGLHEENFDLWKIRK